MQPLLPRPRPRRSGQLEGSSSPTPETASVDRTSRYTSPREIQGRGDSGRRSTCRRAGRPGLRGPSELRQQRRLQRHHEPARRVGDGVHQTEVRIVAPDKNKTVVTSQPTAIELAPGGFTDNVSFFVNVVFPSAGTYWVQTLANTVLLEEFPLIVTDAGTVAGMQTAEEISETVN